MGFLSREWGKYIGDTNVFHFDASSEDITGIYSKLKYLDDIGDSLKNVLIITDPIVYMGNDNDWSFGYNHYYKIDGTSALRFHFVFFRGFYTNFFFASYIDYCLFNTYRPYMKSTIPSDLAQYVYDSVTNDYILQKRIKIIAADSLKFYSNTRIFRDREKLPHIHWACIDNNCMIMLEKMKHIFDNHRTNYKIVISPVYSQEQFNNQDLNKLKQLFGNTNVFDFSGKNEYTINKGNYYDNSHYKPYVAAQMLKKMYVINDSLTH
ncbi:MAG TPA: hypothetical protein VK783_02505 [Bacteroidia bacterium]|jgi:hypothetical protein|nr:hypothetical protein [Bacteroidia bacterium]